ncbi:MAG: hypothetical protein OXT74_11830 [Candidatus Poribacteria bacterium]|nr:hypothetical protein [Candidatus Poribacteria bacterium]
MEKTIRYILVTLALGIVSATMNYTALAKKEVKLIGAEEGNNHTHLTADIIGDTVIIASRGAGTATIYVNEGREWEKQEDLQARDHNARDPFVPGYAHSVAIGAPHEFATPNFAIIGAPKHLHGGDNLKGLDGPQGFGAAYIFRRSGKTWKEQIRLFAPDPAEEDRFGESVSIYRTTAVVGASKDDDNGKNSGSVFVYVLDGTTWKPQAKIVPDDLAGSDAFGEAVSIDENTLAVGAPGHTHSGVRFAGAVYIYVREGGKWEQQAKLTAEDPGKASQFGSNISLTFNTVVVGAPLHDTERGRDAGAVYIFIRNGDRWKQQAKLVSRDSKAGDRFGTGVATTGKSAIIGAPFRPEGAPGSGAAYSFVSVDGKWEEREKITPDDAGQKINYGLWVAMSGNMVIVSSYAAPNEGGAEKGFGTAAYVYNSVDDFGVLPYAVEPFGMSLTTLGSVKRTALLQNFPNPFNPETWMPYRLASDVPVSIQIFNGKGQLLRELNLGEQKAGSYLTRDSAARWDGRDGAGETVSSGVYFYTLQAGTFQTTRRMLVLK